ncbi:phosphate ABC transporter substrate-binding protein, PhoT family [Hymenobacter sp. BT18]|uniref:PstS family phosphate ABC transporter substrate-binding protein n=1 Tax=Hymenobacter sp. BT18 TaxID=2835648 RepID=UPI00143E68DB|nr:substrate-binding domain-containing protein [Hymenobacter sp. BT18]QIX62028.1 phosphate ABC transporter substrate-binding protein, PhoT family [Hymenobacter sp. BT18]
MMKSNTLLLPAGAFLLAGLLLGSCNGGNPPTAETIDDTPTSGVLKIAVDATFEPIVKSHVDTFQQLYQYAKVKPQYVPEADAMEALLNDKVRVAIVSRELTAAEKTHFERLKLIPRTTHVATDALAIIVNPANADSLLTMAQLRDIFTGKATQWQQINRGSKLGDITVVFDSNNSSTSRYVQDSVTRGAALTKKSFASKSNPALLDYVATHTNAIGVIGVNWISDRDDASVQSFLRRVRVVGISTSAAPTSTEDYVQPYQAYLALKTYPLRRNVYVISREARAGLGTGFASFVAGTKGQLIILKSGLMPAVGQTRIVTTKSN